MINFILKFLFFCCTTTAICVSANASNYFICGTVADSLSNEPEAFATIRIFDQQNKEKPLLTFFTDENGKFYERIHNSGDYILIISSIGKNEAVINFSLTDTNQNHDFGTIFLNENTILLKETVITSRKPIIISDGEKLIYNASEDPANNSNNVLDMLRKVPMVSIDGDDNIVLNGNSDFKIYINGKYDSMITQNASEILKSMSASVIIEIEVITNPDAKYDAEGAGGIINLITIEKSIFEGYMANISFSGSNRDFSPSIYALTKIDKVTFSLNYSYFNQRNRTSDRYDEREDFAYDTNKFLNTHQRVIQHANGHIGNFQLSYEPDTLNLITLSGNIMGFGGVGDLYSQYNSYDSNYNQSWSYNEHTIADVSYLTSSISGNYQRNFKKKGHNLVLSCLFNFNNKILEQTTNNFDAINYPNNLSNYKNNITIPSTEYTFQVDYTNPISNKHIIEAGAKYIIRNNENNVNYYNEVKGNYVYDDTQSVLLNQYQNIAAIYAQYNLSLSNWKAKVGLRYEHTKMGVNFMLGNYEDFNSHLNDVVPNIMISYSLNNSSSIRLNYQMRISRPSIDMLNPYKNTINPQNITYGNPELSSMRQNDIAITYSNFIGKFGYNASVKYSQTDNFISNYTYLENGIQYTTYDNLGKYKSTVLSVYGYYLITQKMRINISGYAYYNDFKYDIMNINNSGWSGGLNFDYNYEMPWKLRLGVYGGFASPSKNIQGESSWWKYYGLNLTRKFLKDDRLEISINASNLFMDFTSINTTTTDSFCYTSKWTESNWKIGFSISYRFGSINSNVRKTSKTITNDDIQQNSSNSII